MTDRERIDALREALADPLRSYAKDKAREEAGEVDESYLYDQAVWWMASLRRGDAERVLALLHEASQ